MKVLMRDAFLPGNQYALELCKSLSDNVDVMLLCKRDAGDIEDEIPCKKIIYAAGRNKIDSVCKYIFSIYREMLEIRKGAYNVYHIQSYKNLLFEIPLFYYAKRKCDCVVTTVHNVLPHEVSKTDWRLHDYWYKLSDVLIVHNEATRKCLIEQFPDSQEKIQIVPHGTYTRGFVTNSKPKESGGKKKFLLFGQIRPYKGIDVLIKAVTLMSQTTRNKIQILIVGGQHPKQDSTDYMAMIQSAKIEDCVDFQKRRVPDEDLPGLFENTDFVLFPYKEIYGSGALLMSYTYEKPVIASDVPAFVEETNGGQTGLLFRTENPEDLARCIENAVDVDIEEYEKYRIAIRRLVEEKYNWKVSAKKMKEIYNAAIHIR